MESQTLTRPQLSTSNTRHIFSKEDYLSTLLRGNARLRDELEKSRRKQHQADRERVAAKRTITELKSRLEEIHQDSDKDFISLDPKVDTAEQRAGAAANMSTVESTKPCQEEETNLMQNTYRNLQACTAKFQSTADSFEACPQEHGDRVQILKKGIMDLSVKLQQEQVTVLKKAITLAPHHTEEKGNKSSSEQAEDLETVNLQIHKVNLELLQQALSLKNEYYQKKAPSKHHRIRGYKDQEQQTEQLESTAERQVTDDQKEKEALLSEIQHLKEKLTLEVNLRVETETKYLKLEPEFRRKISDLNKAQSKVVEQEQLLLEIKEKAREELQNLESSSQVQKTYEDQDQELDPVDETREIEGGSGHQKICKMDEKKLRQKKVLMSKIQQLKEKLTAEVNFRVETESRYRKLEAELSRKTFSLDEARSKVAQQEKILLEIKEKAREELQNMESNSDVLPTHKDKEQQVGQLNEITENLRRDQQNICENAVENQKKKEVLSDKIQQLKEKLTVEEANYKRRTHNLEAELLRMTDTVKQAQTKLYLLQGELLRINEKAHPKMNTTHRRKVKEQPNIHFHLWQEEKASLLAAIQGLHQLLHSKHPNLSEQERDMVKKMDDLQRRMTETLENKSQKRQSWMARHFPCLRRR